MSKTKNRHAIALVSIRRRIRARFNDYKEYQTRSLFGRQRALHQAIALAELLPDNEERTRVIGILLQHEAYLNRKIAGQGRAYNTTRRVA